MQQEPLSKVDNYTMQDDGKMDVLPQELVFTNANHVLKLLLATEKDTVEVNLIHVRHCDSAGVAALVRAKAIRLQDGKNTVYKEPQQQLSDLAKFMKVDSLLFS